MAYQATVERGDGRSDARQGRGFSDLTRDLIEIAELQSRLFALDAAEAKSRAGLPAGLLAAGIWFVLATVPLLLFALAWSLIEFAGLAATWAYLIAAGAGLVIGGGMLAGAWFGFRRSIAPFRRSREELARNVRWLKRSLRREPV